jgi:uncharacterized protein (TIGR03437 family)
MLIRTASLLLCAALGFAAAAPTFPALTYSTYLRDNFTPTAIATDSSGNIYLAGNAIVDPSTSQTTVLVVKMNPQATQYLYTRFLGGSVNDTAGAIAVDSTGNAYITGVTTSPDFPVTTGGNLGTPPTTGTERSFAAKLDPNGQLVFSDLLDGSTNSFAQAVAVNATGQVLVSGTSLANNSDTPFLLELDPTGAKMIFSTTGIGGTAITFDSSGNIYVAGTTGSLTYPTTPGTYQPKFPVFQTCVAPCMGTFQGPNQYVTKLDPTGSKIIFSTAVSGSGNTLNNGLAVDAQGNVYLTGLAGAGYPFTVTAPTAPLGPALSALATPALPFLTKLDPAGQKLLYSVPIGGAGVQVDSNGSAYVGGILGLYFGYDVAASLPALASLPSECLFPDVIGQNVGKSAYAAQVDSSGNLQGSQFIGGSSLTIAGVALAGSNLWIAGATNLPNLPFTPNALINANLSLTPLPGAYLGDVDFSTSQPPAGTPQIGCIVDAANLAPAGPVAPYQLLTIFGSGLGGASISFGGLAAPLLYVSSNQINFAVPLVPEGPSGSTMQLTVNSVSSPPRLFPIVSANPSLFVNVSETYQTNSQGYIALAINADGSVNSPTNPAQPGSIVSVFVNGLATDPEFQLYTANGWFITNTSQPNPYVLELGLQIPASSPSFDCQPPGATACTAPFEIYDLNTYLDGPQPGTPGGLSFGGIVYVAP